MNALARILRVAVVTGLLAASLVQAAQSISLISGPHRAAFSGSGASSTPVLSPDGRFVLFNSQARDLATNGAPSPYLDLFLRDLDAGTTALISVKSNGIGGGAGDSTFASVATNGQLIAFESIADDLAPNDTNGVSDVFVRDLVAGTTTLISVRSTSNFSGTAASTGPLISADGRRVVFESTAPDLVANDLNGRTNDIFVRDLAAGTNRLVSVNQSGAGSGNAPSDSPSVSANGRYVGFRSLSSNIVSATSNRLGEIFVRDLDLNTTVWASRDAGSHLFDPSLGVQSFRPVISADGEHLIFLVTNQSPAQLTYGHAILLRYNLTSATTDTIATNALFTAVPEISADGRLIAYETPDTIMLADPAAGMLIAVCGGGTTNSLGVAVGRAPVLSADGSRVAYLGADSTNGPWAAYVFDPASGVTAVAGADTNGLPAEVIATSLFSVSADGHRLAFESLADNLTAGDLNQAADIFVHDRVADTLALVSKRVEGAPRPGPARPVGLGPQSVSQNGRFVAFTSLDNHLADGDDNPWQDAFVRDRLSGTNQILRVPGSNPPGTQRLAFNVVLSTDGRYAAWLEQAVPSVMGLTVAANIFWLDRETGDSAIIPFAGATFGSLSTNGPALGRDGRRVAFAARSPGASFTDVFVRDFSVADGSNQLISVNRLGNAGGNRDSAWPVFSPDGRWLVFQSQASNLTTNSVNGTTYHIYARDLVANRTRLISVEPDSGQPLRGSSSNALFSADSRYVFLQMHDSTTSPRDNIFRYDLHSTNRPVSVCFDCWNPSVSADGRFVAYRTGAFVGIARQVYLADLLTSQTTLISAKAPGFFSDYGPTYLPQISGDGRYVVFAGASRWYVATDTNFLMDVFVRDRLSGTTLLVSESLAGGRPGNGGSSLPVLAPDGRTIVFLTHANDLAAGDYNNSSHLAVVRLGGADTDFDGMDDDWEMAYFSTLARDGTGDFDGDGWNDAQEFRAGTDPTDTGSILRVLSIESATAGELTSITLVWSAQPGRLYRVQQTGNTTAADWADVPGLVTATGTTATKVVQPSSDAVRFYRVVLSN